MTTYCSIIIYNAVRKWRIKNKQTQQPETTTLGTN